MKTAAKSLVVSVCALLWYAATALAATNTLYVFNFDFGIPPSTHVDPVINLGDTVTWIWTNTSPPATSHSTTAAAGQLDSWDSGLHGGGFTYSHTFNELGTFNYYCTVHGFDGGCRSVGAMAGYVAVVLPGAPPYQVIGVTQQGNDLLVTWVTGGICQSNILQRAPGTPDGSYPSNFTDVFTIPSTDGNTTNYLDVGAVTDFPSAYYRVRIPGQ